jgi:hypothetical protein
MVTPTSHYGQLYSGIEDYEMKELTIEVSCACLLGVNSSELLCHFLLLSEEGGT